MSAANGIAMCNQNLTYQQLIKIIFWSVYFTIFLRLQIYKSIAAIFWQSASYVMQNFRLAVFELLFNNVL